MATLKLKTPSTRLVKLREEKDRLAAQRERRAKDQATWNWLYENYKPLFVAKKPKPLKINLHKDFAHARPEGVSWSSIGRVISRWCSRTEYQRAVARGGPRYGIDGVDGEITPEQVQHALKTLRDRGHKVESI